MNKHASPSPFKYIKHNAIIFFGVVAISTFVTLSPAITLRYVDLDMAFFFILITQTLIATLIYLFYLNNIPECKIKIRPSSSTVKFTILSFLVIIFIQLAIYCYRDYLYHYEPSQMNWIAVLVVTLFVPYHEEIVYRACAFGFLCSIYKKNIVIPCVITSLFFL